MLFSIVISLRQRLCLVRLLSQDAGNVCMGVYGGFPITTPQHKELEYTAHCYCSCDITLFVGEILSLYTLFAKWLAIFQLFFLFWKEYNAVIYSVSF